MISQFLGRLAQLDEPPPDADPASRQLHLVDDQAKRGRRPVAVLDQPDRVGDADRQARLGPVLDSQRGGSAGAEDRTIQRSPVSVEGAGRDGSSGVASWSGLQQISNNRKIMTQISNESDKRREQVVCNKQHERVTIVVDDLY